MHSLSISAQRPTASPWRSRRLLALASDERLVEQVRRGNDVAFEVVFERYGAAILSFCRHMLGSHEEAEDAVQHAFAAAHRQLLRDEREIALKAWLYTIARNRCLSILRARREHPLAQGELATDGLSEQVERRAELRELLEDLAELPAEQRSALLLAELGDLSHAEVAGVLGCESQQVKALVYRARSALIARRDARATPCEQIREQLATLRGGSLRRGAIAHHLSACAGCRAYRQEVKRQRQLLAAALPVTPSFGLKASVLGAMGLGGGSASGGGGALLGGVGAAASTGVGGATAAKVAVVAAVAAGAVVGGEAVGERASTGAHQPPSAAAVAARPARPVPAMRPPSAPAADRETSLRRSVPLPHRRATPPGQTRAASPRQWRASVPDGHPARAWRAERRGARFLAAGSGAVHGCARASPGARDPRSWARPDQGATGAHAGRARSASSRRPRAPPRGSAHDDPTRSGQGPPRPTASCCAPRPRAGSVASSRSHRAPTQLLCPADGIRELDVERVGDAGEHEQRGVALAQFDLREVITTDLRAHERRSLGSRGVLHGGLGRRARPVRTSARG